MFDKLANSRPRLLIDNKVIDFIPGSLRFVDGVGQPEIEIERDGDFVLREDANTKFSSVVFSVKPTVDNMELFREYRANQNSHVISITSRNLDCVILDAILTNEVTSDNDEAIDMEFRGKPVNG